MSNTIVRYQAQTAFADPQYPEIVQRIFAHRGIENSQELSLSLADLLPISSLEHVTQAADILADAIAQNTPILIVADFDADGATACALSMRLLKEMGANVDYTVPDRAKHGYGLSVELVNEIVEYPNKPALIMTVDNGISSIDGIALAKENGIDTLVTDHHLPADTLPDAVVIVNPNLSDSQFKSKNLAGVGVAFYVLCALHAKLKQINWYNEKNLTEPKPARYLDLVAVGTIADVVTLDQNNRILVENGLKRIRAQKSCAGIEALFNVAKKESQYALSTDLGFVIGPRINAAGRMEDMRVGINCLLTDDFNEAQEKATQLHQINLTRREVEQDMRDQADIIVKNFDTKNLPFGLCLYQSDWHEGVVGIVAGRLKERHHRPVIVFAKSGEGLLKGSARSIKGFHIRDALDNVSKNNPKLIQKFGGHAMAAGLTINPDDFAKFCSAFDQEVRKKLSEKDLKKQIFSDGSLEEAAFDLELIKTLQKVSPWGQQFPEPVFDNAFFVIDYRVVGEKHLKMILQPENTSIELDAIAFNMIPEVLTHKRDALKMAYQLDINRWQGRINLQLKVLEIQHENK